MDLRKNRLPIAIVLLALLGGGTVLALRNRDAGGAPSSNASAELPTVERDAITAIEVTRPGAATVRLEKRGAEWQLTAPLESAVEQSTVNTALDKLASLELRGIAATRKANHGALEVDAERGIHVVAFGGDAELANLWVGAMRSANTMVRVDGEDAVLSVKGSIKYAFDKDLKEWRDRRIVEENAAHVRAVAFDFGEQHLRFERGANDDWVQAAGQPPIERFSASKVQSIVSALARLRAVDFAPAELDAAGAGLATPAATVTLTIAEPSPAAPAEGEAAPAAPAAAPAPGAPATPAGGAQPAPAAAAAAPRTVVLRLGAAADNSGNAYVQKDGAGLIYTVSGFVAERMHPETSLLQTPEGGEEPEAAAMPPGDMGGGQQIPPEILQQLQQQLGAGGHPPH